METTGAITEYIDVAQLVLYVFWGFFFGLILYLRREDRREGYPLEDERGPGSNPGFVFIADPKTFVSIHDGSTVSKPDFKRDTRELAATPTAPWPGAPLAPTGDPMQAGVGPGSWAERADEPDMGLDGKPKMVPLRAAPEYGVEPADPDLRGMAVVGCDGEVAGTVRDLWVDRADVVFRYLEVEVDGAAQHVLVPMNFAQIDAGQKRVRVGALRGEHFANVPAQAVPDKVTLLEEERVMAYFGAGLLYADPARQEPLL